MTELEQIAQSVAQALGLKLEVLNWIDADGYGLKRDGSNVFGEHWQVRCRDWLHEQGHTVTTSSYRGALALAFSIQCPAAEFCARAIHELMK